MGINYVTPLTAFATLPDKNCAVNIISCIIFTIKYRIFKQTSHTEQAIYGHCECEKHMMCS